MWRRRLEINRPRVSRKTTMKAYPKRERERDMENKREEIAREHKLKMENKERTNEGNKRCIKEREGERDRKRMRDNGETDEKQ